MSTTTEALAIAIEHHRAGRLGAAEAIYQRMREADPSNADAFHLLGLVQAQTGRPAMAVQSFQSALALRPDWPDALANLGNVLRELGRPADAESVLRRAVALQPDSAEARNNLGTALETQGKTDEAIDCYRRALAIRPEFAEAFGNLGRVLRARGEPAAAIDCLRRAVALRPDLAAAQYSLAVALDEIGDRAAAIDAYRRAVALRPAFAEAWNNLGNALRAAGRLEESVESYRQALASRSDFAAAHYNLGLALGDLGRLDEAVWSFRLALELQPDLAEGYVDLGNALKNRGELQAAVECYQRALALRPDLAAAHNNLGNALRDQGLLDEALTCYRRAIELNPGQTTAHSNLLYTMQYVAGLTPADLADAHAEFDRRHAARVAPAARVSQPITIRSGPLRLGFVSPDLGRHPVGSFLVRVLENLASEGVETVCYSDRAVKDDLTHRLQAAATAWRDVLGVSDERLTETIRADRIDVLFDLAGHTARNRLLVFARRAAPVQVTWIGYEGTTGLSAMDDLIADRLVIPPGDERFHRERVLRMPDGYLCYDPPASAPAVGQPPCLSSGFPTFGSFSNPAKVTPEVVAAWARILNKTPDARMIWKYRGLGDPIVRGRFLGHFAAAGVGPARLDLRPWSTYSDYLATYADVDLVLDTFPFSGSATTCEALWMGVPVVTFPGATFASRHTLSHLTQVILTETIAGSLDEYVELAAALANAPDRLAALRSSLRERMAASPLCDGRRFARELVTLLEKSAIRSG